MFVVLQQELNELIARETEILSAPESERQFRLLQENVNHLQNRLFTVSDLYNQISEPYKLWEFSLIIIYLCKHDDLALVNRLWKSIIYR